MSAVIARSPSRSCVRCDLIATLDRAGYCPLCAWELAHPGRVYINWGLLFSGRERKTIVMGVVNDTHK